MPICKTIRCTEKLKESFGSICYSVCGRDRERERDWRRKKENERERMRLKENERERKRLKENERERKRIEGGRESDRVSEKESATFDLHLAFDLSS